MDLSLAITSALAAQELAQMLAMVSHSARPLQLLMALVALLLARQVVGLAHSALQPHIWGLLTAFTRIIRRRMP